MPSDATPTPPQAMIDRLTERLEDERRRGVLPGIARPLGLVEGPSTRLGNGLVDAEGRRISLIGTALAEEMIEATNEAPWLRAALDAERAKLARVREIVAFSDLGIAEQIREVLDDAD